MSKYHDPKPVGDGPQQGFYNVTIAHDLFTIRTVVIADDKEEAAQIAGYRFTEDLGLPSWIADDSLSVTAELEGVFR